MKEARKIKGLKSQLKKMEGDAEALKVEAANKQREYNAKRNKIQTLKYEIERLDKNGNIRVSEHAIVRYFERVKGFDISEIEKEILTDEVLKLVEQLGGNGGYPNKDFKVLMKDFTVTTII
jgi:predicted DNA binding CopG/RHH family protein